MAQRPYVVDAKVLEILKSPPIRDLLPSLGSFVQRKTADIGCFPFPFWLSEEGVPLDGRIVDGVTLPVRPVPYWCSENGFAEYYGDQRENNGEIVWSNESGTIVGSLKQKGIPDAKVVVPNAFVYDSIMGVTYPTRRVNRLFVGMNNTVPQEWIDLRDSHYRTGVTFTNQDDDGITYGIVTNPLFKAWTGLTLKPAGEISFNLQPMEGYVNGGGTYSRFFSMYNYGCLDQVFNYYFNAAGEFAKDFWEGELYSGISFGPSGGLRGELFLLNFVGGKGETPVERTNAGSIYLPNGVTPFASFPWNEYFKGASAGATFSGRQLAINVVNFINASQPLKDNEPHPERSFIDTMALYLGTVQATETLVTGGSTIIRAINHLNPCSASLLYREDTELGRWGYEVERITINEGEEFQPGSGVPAIQGCNINTFVEYMGGPSAAQNGLPHPLSLIFWRRAGGTDIQGTINDLVGFSGTSPIVEKLEGIHDHLCYELFRGSTLQSRVYYPVRPITEDWYRNSFLEKYNDFYSNADPGVEQFAETIGNKFKIGFPTLFKGQGSLSSVSLDTLRSQSLAQFQLEGGVQLAGVTGVMFPYLIPLATNGMTGIIEKNLIIGGEFNNFEAWGRNVFGIDSGSTGSSLYRYYADGVSSGASFSSETISPYYSSSDGQSHNFRLYSWDALNKIAPRAIQSGYGVSVGSTVKSSFFARPDGDVLGVLEYSKSGATQSIKMDGTNVPVDPLLFVPSALPTGPSAGLKITSTTGLGCDSYVNLVRYANVKGLTFTGDAGGPPRPPGLTAKRILIASVDLSADSQSFSDFDSGTISGDDAGIFDRTTLTSPNQNSNFYTPTGGDRSADGNFFFRTSDSSPFKVFGGSYYLEPDQYVQKYGNTSTVNVNWWEDVANPPGSIVSTANDIWNRLVNPEPTLVDQDVGSTTITSSGDNWATNYADTSRFKGSPYTNEQAPYGTGGIQKALNEYKLHPAFVYRFLTSAAMASIDYNGEGDSDQYFKGCLKDWTVGATTDDQPNQIPCHQYSPLVGEFFNNNFPNYFNGGQTGCNQYGSSTVDETADPTYLDFFYKSFITTGDGPDDGEGNPTTVPLYAYKDEYYNPELVPGYQYQNTACTGTPSNVPDPPVGATLTSFGLTFANAIAAVSGQTPNFSDNSEIGRRAIRNLFGYTGNTGTNQPDGSGNNVGTGRQVGQWLNGKLAQIFDYYNENYPNSANANQIAKVSSFLGALYGNAFTQYAQSLSNNLTYRLWAIKPRCLDEFDADCLRLAGQLGTGDIPTIPVLGALTDPGFPGGDGGFVGSLGGGDRIGRSDLRPTNTTNTQDIIAEKGDFIGAVQTLYVEPLGKAANVLATQAQGVSRATIRSTVFGKLTTVIDSGGFLRDVYMINFESGFGTKIIGNTGSNSITISVDGLSLGSLTDVASIAATDGDVLSYNLVNSRWTNRSLYDLNDMHAGMRYTFSDTTEPLFNLNIGQVSGEALTTVLANVGTLKFNAKSEEVPTEVYFSVSDSNGNDQTGLFNRFGTGVAGTLLLKKFGDPNTFFRFQVDGLTGPYAERTNAVAADTGLRVSLINSGTGTLSAGDRLAAFLFLEPATNRVNFYYQALPPTGAGVTGGSRWMNSETGTEYIYINDGDTNQWVQAV